VCRQHHQHHELNQQQQLQHNTSDQSRQHSQRRSREESWCMRTRRKGKKYTHTSLPVSQSVLVAVKHKHMRFCLSFTVFLPQRSIVSSVAACHQHVLRRRRCPLFFTSTHILCL
jgi:hypothetical protein